MITMGVRLSEHPERMIIMSMRGGYQIIDLKNVPLYSGFLKDNVENHIHVKGIYYNLYHSNAKMILLSGLNMDNKPHRDYEIIPYEEDNEFKAILKKVWNTDKHLVYTYFLHIAEDDYVYITYEELDYDRVDKTFNDKSDIAIANSTVTKKVKALDAEDLTFLKLDGSRNMSGALNMAYNKITNSVLIGAKLESILDCKNNEITNLAAPTDTKSAARKADVDYVKNLVTNINNYNHAHVELHNTDSSSSLSSFDAIITNRMVIGQLKAKSALTTIGNIVELTGSDFEQIKLIAKSIGDNVNIISGQYSCTIFNVSDASETLTVTIRIDINSNNAVASLSTSTSSKPIKDGIYTFYGVIG